MLVTPVKTPKINNTDKSIFQILDEALPSLRGNCVVAVTSKIVSICEGSVVDIGTTDKHDLIARHAERYIDASENRYGITLTVAHNILIPSSGIDESNGNGHYVLWPKDPQNSANKIRQHLQSKHKDAQIAVVITDSKTTPLRWGTTGVTLAHSGFDALNNYIGEPDIYGKKMNVTKANVSDALGAIAVACMGEGAEQTPIAVIEDAHFVKFTGLDPSQPELAMLHIDLEDDVYAPLLKSNKWKRGGKQR